MFVTEARFSMVALCVTEPTSVVCVMLLLAIDHPREEIGIGCPEAVNHVRTVGFVTRVRAARLPLLDVAEVDSGSPEFLAAHNRTLHVRRLVELQEGCGIRFLLHEERSVRRRPGGARNRDYRVIRRRGAVLELARAD